LLTDRAEPSIPQAVNLGALPGGVLQTTVVGAVAAVTTQPVPAGELVGTTAVQKLTNKEVVAKLTSLSNTTTPLIIDLSTTNLAVASDLQQATLFANPEGSAEDGFVLRIRLKSTVPRALTWAPAWSAENGPPLPTTTTGGETYDLFTFQRSATTNKMVLTHNTQWLRPISPSGVTPGTYPCPTAMSVDTFGRITSVADGPCGGGTGGSAAAGLAGDIQFKGVAGTLDADSAFLTQNKALHQTYTQALATGQGVSYVGFRDASGFQGVLVAPTLTANRVWTLPDSNGPLSGASAPAGANRRGLVFTLGDEQGSALLTTAVWYATIPFSCTLSAYALTIDAVDTTMRVKFWRVAGGTAKPVAANSISTSGVGVPAGTHVKSTTLSDFTSTSIAADDTVAMAISVANTAKFASATLYCDL
jgi:hypothetical protein